jgi:hypothetical protein
MKMTRRSLIQKVTGLSALLVLAPQALMAEEKRRARGGDSKAAAAAAGPLGYPLVDPAGNAGKAVNYVTVHANLKDAKLKTERQGVAWDQQFCSNCSFYKEVGTKDGGKVGTCTIFVNQLVVEKGWCSSWNKKA